MTESGRLRIGELSRRVGESPELLRAWESRYGVVRPERTAGGLRLYSEQDERRIRVMRHHIDAGLSAAEAARLATLADEQAPTSGSATPAAIEQEIERSLETLDEPTAQAALDRLLISVGLPEALSEVILPFLRQLGQRWSTGQVSVAQEHFASNVIGARLRGLTRGWGEGVGPRALLACAPGELHDLGLLSFGLVLRERGWRITFLGADTPLSEIATAVELLPPKIVVLSAVIPRRFRDQATDLKALGARVRTGLAGAGASVELAHALGVEPLVGDLVEVAASLTP
jgi:DNA-binding transcriptional MerR regulator